jgi:ATP-dependent protease ClpP protease subunit
MGRIVMADYSNRYIMINLPRGRGAIHEGTAEGVERVLEKMNRLSNTMIRFFLHGHDGGDFYACLKIAQAIAYSTSPVTMVPFIRVRSGAFWLTQAGERCIAVPGTRFIFHHATDYFAAQNLRNRKLSQKDYAQRVEELIRIDAMQLLFFTKRGRPIRRIFELFGREASMSISEVRRLGLVQGLFDRADFEQIRTALQASGGKQF